MPTYAYTARDERGAPANGTVQAASVAEVTQQLRAAGKYPVSIRPAGTGPAAAPQAPRTAGIRIPRADVIQFSQQLAIMIETGVTLSEALDCIAAQTIKPNVKLLIQDLGQHVQGGSDFSSACSRHPRTFPRVFVALIKAAEKSGMLSKLLTRATHYLRDEQETLRRVRGALTYPCIMLAFAVTTTMFLLAFVLPRFTVIYANKGAALPTPTKILMTLSDFVVGHWPALLIGAGLVASGTFFGLQTRSGRRWWHFVQLHVPLLGSLFRKLHLSRGLRMIGTMAGAGVSLVDCVATAQELCGNTYFREMWDEVSVKITAGKQMSEPLMSSPLVPRAVAQMIHSGEKSGKLAQVTEQVAGFSEQQLKDTIADLTRYIEPTMIVIMGLIIGGVALALMLPVFTISRVVGH
jgi:type IV pilus assembly protein PilC